jgi:quinohemoprotein ethanol dehydrogenase
MVRFDLHRLLGASMARLSRFRFFPLLMAATLVVGAARGAQDEAPSGGVDDAALAAQSNTSEWLAYGRTSDGQRYSQLDQVNLSTVAKLGVDWFVDLPEDVGLISTPLVISRTVYFTTNRNVVRAVDARTGKSLWNFDPKGYQAAGARMPLSFLHGGRGLAAWRDKIYVSTADGRLIALDDKSGKEVWSVQVLDPARYMYMTGAPMAFAGKILVGPSGAETDPESRGYVAAYDAENGKLLWRFDIIPGDPSKGYSSPAMAMAAKTWSGKWWTYAGGGHAWGEGFAYDRELNLVYIGTGNGTPVPRKFRNPAGGDNLFVSSIVALDATTGEYRWHYQTTPAEQWDFDSSSPIVLADLKIKGRTVKALMQAPKNGFFYVIDRTNGKFISAEPYTKVNWASRIDAKTGRPVELPDGDYSQSPKVVYPSSWGAHAWEAESYNPVTGLVYVPVRVDPEKYSINEGRGLGYGTEPAGEPSGSLLAWDPVKQKRAWEVQQSYPWSPGTLTTAGNLVFQGTAEGELVAYDATNGKVVWKYNLGLGIAAPPITYSIDGRQYVSVLVGWGGGWALRGEDVAKLGWAYKRQMRRLVTFSLSGTTVLPPLPPPSREVPPAFPFEVDEKLAKRGAAVYGNCFFCHGLNAIAGGLSPDLRASPLVLSKEAFESVVRDGSRRPLGMPSFAASDIPDEDLLALRHYFRQQANIALANPPAAGH